MIELDCYEFICYAADGSIIGEYFQMNYPVLSDCPDGTVRIDIAIPQA